MSHINSLKISKDDIRVFNFCRIYLQVELLSDIIRADGKRIRPAIWKGERQLNCHRWKWPHQPRPDNKGWAIWKRLLQSTFLTTAEGALTRRRPMFSYSSDWNWFYSESELRLYERKNGQFWFRPIIRHTGRHSRHRQHEFGQPSICNTVPNNLKIATVYPKGNNMMLESTGLIGVRDSKTSTKPLWTSTIEVTEEAYDDQEFHDEWLTGQMILVADGSAKNGLGTGA